MRGIRGYCAPFQIRYTLTKSEGFDIHFDRTSSMAQERAPREAHPGAPRGGNIPSGMGIDTGGYNAWAGLRPDSGGRAKLSGGSSSPPRPCERLWQDVSSAWRILKTENMATTTWPTGMRGGPISAPVATRAYNLLKTATISVCGAGGFARRPPFYPSILRGDFGDLLLRLEISGRP